MKKEKPLTAQYEQYIGGKLTKKDFEGGIFQYLIENFERYRLFGGDRERWEDFLSWLYPHLSRAVDKYRDCGSSFDAYISGLVNGASRDYISRETNHDITEYICWQARTEEMSFHDNEPDYSGDEEKISLPGDISPRQVLLLLLKSYFFVSPELAEKAAKITGMDYEDIRNMLDDLRKRRSEKDAEILDLAERIYCQYYRVLTYQQRMFAAQQGTTYYDKMKIRSEKASKRFYAMRRRLRGMKLSPSNQMVADVLGIPRGTVDSSLSAIKNRICPPSDEAV